MIKKPFGLHTIIHFDNISNFESEINLVKPQKYIWLTGNENDIIKNSSTINNIISDNNLLIIVESEKILKEKINVFAFVSKNYESIKLMKSRYPYLKIGGIADNLADAKNVELFSGDFLYMGPLDTIGQIPYISLIPKEPDYEWQLIDISIPVMSFGHCSSQKLTELTNKANLFGHAFDVKQFTELSESSYRFTID